LRNLIKQYPVSYDSDYKTFVVHRESVGKKDMEFRMHKNGIHYYDPRNEESDFITPVSGIKQNESDLITHVSGIKQHFTPRHIKGAATNAGSDVRTNAHDPPGAHFDYDETPARSA
jgi:hypothetical protein